MNPVVAIYGCFERWNIFASDKNDMSPVSPLVRSREWAKSEFNVGHSRVAVQTRKSIGALAHCNDGIDVLASPATMTWPTMLREGPDGIVCQATMGRTPFQT